MVPTSNASIKAERPGWFHRDRNTDASYILRGLRLKAEGRSNSDGQLVAVNIRFFEQDLRTAQALEARVDPVETLANSTEALARQVDELSRVANAAGALAANAQQSAEQAQADANTANERISGPDDYEVYKTFSVHFNPGSARPSKLSRDR